MVTFLALTLCMGSAMLCHFISRRVGVAGYRRCISILALPAKPAASGRRSRFCRYRQEKLVNKKNFREAHRYGLSCCQMALYSHEPTKRQFSAADGAIVNSTILTIVRLCTSDFISKTDNIYLRLLLRFIHKN